MLDNKMGASHFSIEERIGTKLSYIYMKMGQPHHGSSIMKKSDPNFPHVHLERSLQYKLT
jgi:hypothetical protein